MSKRLLLITTLFYHYASSRYIVKQPYPDYSYTYSDASHLQSPVSNLHPQPYHSSFYSPPGTYYDQRRGILRPFPGGGVPVLVDYHKRCSNQYVGVKAHPDQHQYYYVCKPDSVIFGKCQNLQIFNATSGQCVQHPPPEYIPTCTEEGRFPLFSDCHLYYKCEEDLVAKIYTCPPGMIFSPVGKNCINGNMCTPTRISPDSSYIPEYCANKFPPCFESGVFRSPSDCSLYYKCDLQTNGVYMQTRLRCPEGNFFDLQSNECLPANEVACDCIQVAELVYPKQPMVYPSQYDVDALEENHYPIEQLQEDLSGSRNNRSRSENEIESKLAVGGRNDMTTTLIPTILNNEFVKQDGVKAFVLSDYIDIDDQNIKLESQELEALTRNLYDTTLSSEEMSTGIPNIEADSEEATTFNLPHQITAISDINLHTEEEKLGLAKSIALSEENGEKPFELNKPTEDLQDPATTTEVNLRTEKIMETEAQIQEEEATAAPVSAEKIIETQAHIQEEKPTGAQISAEKKIETEAKSQKEEATVAPFSAEKIIETEDHIQEEKATAAQVSAEKIVETEAHIQKKEATAAQVSAEKIIETDGHIQEEKTTAAQVSAEKIIETEDHIQEEEITGAQVSPAPPSEPKNCENIIDGDENNNDNFNEDTLSENINCLSKLKTTQINTDTKPVKGENTRDSRSPTHKQLFTTIATDIPISKKQQFTTTQTVTRKTPFQPEIDNLDSDLLDSKEHFGKMTTEQITDDSEVDNETTQANDVPLNTIPNISDESNTHFLKSSLIEDDVAINENLNDTENELAKLKLKSNTSHEADENSIEKNFKVSAQKTEAFKIENSSVKTPETATLKATFEKSTLTPASEIIAENLFSSDTETKINNFLTLTQANEQSDPVGNEVLPLTTKLHKQTSKSATLRQINFREEELIPADSKSHFRNGFPEQTTDSQFDDDYTTISAANETPTTTATEVKSSQNQILHDHRPFKKDPKEVTNSLTNSFQKRQIPFHKTLAGNESVAIDSTGDSTNSQAISHKENNKSSHNEIFTSAETVQAISSPDTFSTTLTMTQAINTSPKLLNTLKSTSNSNEKLTNTLVLHVREGYDQLSRNNSTTKSLHLTLQNKPVINKTDNNFNIDTIPDQNQNIPRLEIIAEHPIDVHFSICPSTCIKNHKHNSSETNGTHAVLLKWFANRSKQTLGFETANEANAENNKDC